MKRVFIRVPKPYDISDEEFRQIRQMAKDQACMVLAIKYIRDTRQCSLYDAKQIVDAIAETPDEPVEQTPPLIILLLL